MLITTVDFMAATEVNSLPGEPVIALNKLILGAVFGKRYENLYDGTLDSYADIYGYLGRVEEKFAEEFKEELEVDGVDEFGWDPKDGFARERSCYGKPTYLKGNLFSYCGKQRYAHPDTELPFYTTGMNCNLSTMQSLGLKEVFGEDISLWFETLLERIKSGYPDTYWAVDPEEVSDFFELGLDEPTEEELCELSLGNFYFDEDGMHFIQELSLTDIYEYALSWNEVSDLFTDSFIAITKGRQ